MVPTPLPHHAWSHDHHTSRVPGRAPTAEDSHDGPDHGPRVTGAEVRDLSRLRRSTTDRKVAGVAGGLARHLDIDPLILRVGFVVLAFFGGAGLILYAAIWALVPEDDSDRAAVHLDERSRTVALVALGVIAALALVGDSWGAFWFPWPLAIIGVIAFVWLSRSGGRDRTAPEPTGWEVGSDPADPAGPGPAPAYVAPRPRDPRKRGPILFWFTLLLIAVAEGVLGIVDAAGVPVADSAYAALATAVIATMLVVGAFLGRAGGLIALGLVASVGLIAATAADRWDGDRVFIAPTSADEVAPSYSLTTGELIVDLSEVSRHRGARRPRPRGQRRGRPDRGRRPRRRRRRRSRRTSTDPAATTCSATQGGGIDWTRSASHDGGPDAPAITIDAGLEVGEITVTTE